MLNYTTGADIFDFIPKNWNEMKVKIMTWYLKIKTFKLIIMSFKSLNYVFLLGSS